MTTVEVAVNGAADRDQRKANVANQKAAVAAVVSTGPLIEISGKTYRIDGNGLARIRVLQRGR